jgi:cholesterol transport system auxiliary component
MVRLAPCVAAGVLCVVLGGCASHPPATYDLIAPRAFAGSSHPSRMQLVVDEPSALHALDTNRIMVKPDGNQIAYFKGAAWSDRLPRLIQARMVETFQNTGAVSSVSSSSDTVDSDYTLDTEIRSFQIDSARTAPAADVDIFAKLVDSKSDRVVASKGFTARVPATNDSTQAGVNALNQALTEVLQDTTNWVASRPVRSAPRSSAPRTARVTGQAGF